MAASGHRPLHGYTARGMAVTAYPKHCGFPAGRTQSFGVGEEMASWPHQINESSAINLI